MEENNVTTTGVPADETPARDDIALIEAAIDNLAAVGVQAFADEIAMLKMKREALVAKAEAEAHAVEQEAAVVEKKASNIGVAVAHGAEIALLLAILGKLFGVI